MKRALIIAAAAIGLAITAGFATATDNDAVCPGTHLSDASGPSHTYTAPDGYLVARICVKAGSANQGDGPFFIDYDPPVKTVTFSHPSGKDISHYSVTLVHNSPPTTEVTPSTSSQTTEPVSSTSPPSDSSTPSSTPSTSDPTTSTTATSEPSPTSSVPSTTSPTPPTADPGPSPTAPSTTATSTTGPTPPPRAPATSTTSVASPSSSPELPVTL